MLSPTRFCNICQILPPPLFKERGGVIFGKNHSEQNTDFTFDYVKKKCREYKICNFLSCRANKKDCLNNPDIIYRNKYLQIKLL